MFGEILGAVAGGLLGGKGGGGSQTVSKDPWEAVQPWLKDLISQGQDLSSYYSSNPFNAAQTAAYGNMANQSAYMRSLVPSLLGQVSGQPLAFDPTNPAARPQAYQFNRSAGILGLMGDAQGGPNLGLLSGGGMNPVSTMPARIAPAPAPKPAVQEAPPWSPIPGMAGFVQMPGAYDVWNRDYNGQGT